jgi:hypothetical protein
MRRQLGAFPLYRAELSAGPLSQKRCFGAAARPHWKLASSNGLDNRFNGCGIEPFLRCEAKHG